MIESATILFASASTGNAEVMVDFLESQGYEPIQATTLDDLDAVIDDRDMDVALIDADGFAPEVWSRCETLQQKGVPFFVISQHAEAVDRQDQEFHAERVFEKPLGQDAVLQTIDQLLQE